VGKACWEPRTLEAGIDLPSGGFPGGRTVEAEGVTLLFESILMITNVGRKKSIKEKGLFA
jgi:hypothetical protein